MRIIPVRSLNTGRLPRNWAAFFVKRQVRDECVHFTQHIRFIRYKDVMTCIRKYHYACAGHTLLERCRDRINSCFVPGLKGCKRRWIVAYRRAGIMRRGKYRKSGDSDISVLLFACDDCVVCLTPGVGGVAAVGALGVRFCGGAGCGGAGTC